MTIKELKEILKTMPAGLNDKPVRIWIGKQREADGGKDRYLELDEQNWEVGGTTLESSFLSICKKS